MFAQDASRSRDAAVIDIGSNSVRLVVYRLDGRAIWTVFNEKVLAGLGRDLAETGALSQDGAKAALGALKRFKAVVSGRSVRLSVVATAAVRQASDGPAFVREVREATGFAVRVLSGDEEARYSALGVLAGAPDAEGVVGDLGGSSLELIRVAEGRGGAGITLPLGPFALRGDDGFDPIRARAKTAAVLRQAGEAFATRSFYAVGGGWRNLALLQMRIAGYPLQIVHQYEMSAQDALEAARFIARQSKSSLERIEGVSKRRLETLPYAAVVLEGLIEHLGLKRVVISAYGLREGLLFEAMPEAVRALDPLIEGCAALGEREGVDSRLGAALEAWLKPVFAKLPALFEPGRDEILTAASCRLADLGARLHPDHRADLVFEQVLRTPIPGMTHPERAFLAASVFSRHTAAPTPPEAETLNRVLSDDRRQRARVLGAAIRLGCDLSGRSAEMLGRSRLRRDGSGVRLDADAPWADMLLGEQTAKRARILNEQLKLELSQSGLKTGG